MAATTIANPKYVSGGRTAIPMGRTGCITGERYTPERVTFLRDMIAIPSESGGEPM